jgi:LytTr DNA-binding domain-containing protein
VKGSPLQLALREMQAAAKSRYTRVGLILVTALLALSGPFDTFETFNPGQRIAYWATMVVGCYFVGQGATTFFIETLRDSITQRWPRVIVSGLLASLPVTSVVIVINGLAHGHVETATSLTLWLYTTLVTLGVVIALVFLSDAMHGSAPAAPLGNESPGTPPILARVPLPQRGKLLALIVEDHYVDIVTDRGKSLVLMRLADAMRETEPIAGLQIHRSHWVARDAVVRSHRSDGRLLLELSNGMRLPVSRGYLPQVRDAGLA